MKITSVALVTLFSIFSVEAFAPNNRVQTRCSVLFADTQAAPVEAKVAKKKVKELGLLTFDLDDTLYPIAPIIEAANSA